MITPAPKTMARRTRRITRWAAAAATGGSLVAGCTLLPTGGSAQRAAAPAATATPAPSVSPSSAQPSQPGKAPTAMPDADALSDAEAVARAQAVLASVGADTWPTHYSDHVSTLPPGFNTASAQHAASMLQAWTLAAVFDPTVVEASSPQAARSAYMALLPQGLHKRVQQYLTEVVTDGPGANWELMTTLDPEVVLLDDPAILADYGSNVVVGGEHAGDLRLTASVVAVYPVTYRGQDYAVPVHRLLSIDVPPDASTADAVLDLPVAWITACSPQVSDLVTPDVYVPDHVLQQGIDRMVHNSPILASSDLGNPLDEPDVQPVARLQCD